MIRREQSQATNAVIGCFIVMGILCGVLFLLSILKMFGILILGIFNILFFVIFIPFQILGMMCGIFNGLAMRSLVKILVSSCLVCGGIAFLFRRERMYWILDLWSRSGRQFRKRAKENPVAKLVERKLARPVPSGKSSFIHEFSTMTERQFRKSYSGEVGVFHRCVLCVFDQFKNPFELEKIDLAKISVVIIGVEEILPIMKQREGTNSEFELEFFIRKVGKYEIHANIGNESLSHCPIRLEFVSMMKVEELTVEAVTLKKRTVPIYELHKQRFEFILSAFDRYGNATGSEINFREHVDIRITAPEPPILTFDKVLRNVGVFKLFLSPVSIGLYTFSISTLGKPWINGEKMVILEEKDMKKYIDIIKKKKSVMKIARLITIDRSSTNLKKSRKKKKQKDEEEYKGIELELSSSRLIFRYYRLLFIWAKDVANHRIKALRFRLGENEEEEEEEQEVEEEQEGEGEIVTEILNRIVDSNFEYRLVIQKNQLLLPLVIETKHKIFQYKCYTKKCLLIYSILLFFREIIVSPNELNEVARSYMKFGKGSTIRKYRQIQKYSKYFKSNILLRLHQSRTKYLFEKVLSQSHLLDEARQPISEEDLGQIITSLLVVRKEVENIVTRYFQGDVVYLKCVNSETANILHHKMNTQSKSNNEDGSQQDDISSLFIRYLDHSVLHQRLGDEESQVDSILKFISSYRDKDLLRESLRHKLACRMIFRPHFFLPNTLVRGSVLEERTLLMKLRMQFGYSFTAKMQKMIKDSQINIQLNEEYQRSLLLSQPRSSLLYFHQKKKNDNDDDIKSIKFKPLVLTSGVWGIIRTNEANKFQLQKTLEKQLLQFSKFYKKKYHGSDRKLTWLYYEPYSQCELISRFTSGSYFLYTSVLEAHVLMLFNPTIIIKEEEEEEEGEKNNDNIVVEEEKKIMITKEEIYTALGIKNTRIVDFILKKFTQIKVLQIKKNQEFVINEKFRCKKKKIHLKSLRRRRKKENKKKSLTICMENRKYSIDAAIVRVMKSKKGMSHQQLLMEVAQQTSKYFSIDSRVIKRRIDSLLEREFLRRDQNNSKFFWYVA